MSDVPKKLVVDLSTGTRQYIDLTPEEIQQRELDAIAAATAEAERTAQAEATEALKASARAKLVAGETLTEEEAAVLVI
jgi:predicted DNA-binding transcriptional regulator YafY